MRSYRQIKIISVLPIMLIGLIISGEAFAKNIKRSCSATYSAMVDSVTFNSKTVGLPYDVAQVGYIGETFNAQGGCGKLVPNRCRKRARDKLLACARAHVKSPGQLPQECNPNTVKKYPGANLASVVKNAACKSELTTSNHLSVRSLLPSNIKLKVLLKVHVRGGDDCGIEKPGRVTVDGRQHKRSGNKLYVVEPLKHFEVSCP